MPSRPCDYCLGLQEDSVFIDLNLDDDGRLFMVRISFDGYGCCRLGPDERRKLDFESSQKLKVLIELKDYENPMVGAIIGRHLEASKDLIWEDALIEHNLIK